MDKYDGKQGTAIDLLVYYMKTLFQTSGLNWNDDNEAEIANLVDAIITASKSDE